MLVVRAAYIRGAWLIFGILRYLKTDGQTDKGDYYGPQRVNLGSKISEKVI